MVSLQDKFFQENTVSHKKLPDLNSGVYRDGGHSNLVTLVEGTESSIKKGSLKVTSTTVEIYLGGGNWLPVGSDDNPVFDSLEVNGVSRLNGNVFVGTPSSPRDLNIYGDLTVEGISNLSGRTYHYGGFTSQGTSYIYGDLIVGSSSTPRTSVFFGNLAVEGYFGVDGDIEVTNDLSIAEKLTVFSTGQVGTSSEPGEFLVYGNLGNTGDYLAGGRILLTTAGTIPGFIGNGDFYTNGRVIIGDFDGDGGDLYLDGNSGGRAYLNPPAGSGLPLVLDGSGNHVAYDSSTEDHKENVREIPLEESKKLLSLASKRYEKFGVTQDGHIAEEINELFPHMVCKDSNGKILGYRTSEVIPHLLNLIKDLYNKLS